MAYRAARSCPRSTVLWTIAGGSPASIVRLRHAWQSVEIILRSLNEVLAYFAERGEYFRSAAAAYVDGIQNDPDTLLRPNFHQIMPEG